MTALADARLQWGSEIFSNMLATNHRHLSNLSFAKADMAMRYIPMEGVSGDYYDLLPLSNGIIGLAIGDVCGKGIKAAFLMSSIRAALRSRLQMDQASSGELLAHINKYTYHSTSKCQFVTLSYGIWDMDNHTFTYSNAGHPPILHYQAETGMVCRLDTGGIVLGVLEDMVYPTSSITLNMGDALILYTDGITEASSIDDEVFGVDRLSEVVATHGWESSDMLAEAIMKHSSQFAAQGWQDDVTLMVIKRVDE